MNTTRSDSSKEGYQGGGPGYGRIELGTMKFLLPQPCQAEITTAYIYAVMVTPQNPKWKLTKPDKQQLVGSGHAACETKP